MTDQTQFAPLEIALPDLDTTREKLSLLARTWRVITAPLPGSARMRRDIGLEEHHSDHDPHDRVIDTVSRHGMPL